MSYERFNEHVIKIITLRKEIQLNHLCSKIKHKDIVCLIRLFKKEDRNTLSFYGMSLSWYRNLQLFLLCHSLYI